MKQIDLLKKANRQSLRNLVTFGYVRPCQYSGSGRHTSVLDKSGVIERFLRENGIAYCWGNDAPRGGASGKYIALTSLSLLKEIGAVKATAAFRKNASGKWVKPKMLKPEQIKPYLDSAILEVDPKDINDSNGRYWLSCYRGCGRYILVVHDSRILASIPDGFSRLPYLPSGNAISRQAWEDELKKECLQRFGDNVHFIEAEGSGCSFFLRNEEDCALVNTKSYLVPSVDGGIHRNLEIV